jgi:CBS domain-containing protein
MLVEKRMRKNPQTITPEDYLASALANMHKSGFRRLPIVKDWNLVGIIHRSGPARHRGSDELPEQAGLLMRDC